MATQKKLDHMTDNKKQVQEAKEKVYETPQTAKDRTTETKNRAGSNLSKKTGATNDKEKLSYMTDNKKQVQEAKEKVHGMAQTPKDRTTKTRNQAGSNPFEKTDAANDKVSAVAQSAKESALVAKDKTATVFEKTSVQVKGMAASATDAVKRTLGMGTKVDPTKDTTKEDIN